MALTLVSLIVILVITNRYVIPLLMSLGARDLLDRSLAPGEFTPTVCIVVPMFNEGRSIVGTIECLARQSYSRELTRVVIVDDCSTDDSYALASRAALGGHYFEAARQRDTQSTVGGQSIVYDCAPASSTDLEHFREFDQGRRLEGSK